MLKFYALFFLNLKSNSNKIKSGKIMNKECVFCNIKKEDKLIDGTLAFILEDCFPVTKYHSLIIPKRHFENYFDIRKEELLEIHDLLTLRKKQILSEDSFVTGFNIGINIGHDAGQSIFHFHVHLIPRRLGDLENPKGGVRGVIPSKRNY